MQFLVEKSVDFAQFCKSYNYWQHDIDIIAEVRCETCLRGSVMALYTEIKINTFLPTFDVGGYAFWNYTVLKLLKHDVSKTCHSIADKWN